MASFFILPITAAQVPIVLTWDMGGPTPYQIQFDYNERMDRYTATFYDLEGVTLYSTILTYGGAVVNAVLSRLTYTNNLIPIGFQDLNGGIQQIRNVTKETLGNGVDLYVGNP